MSLACPNFSIDFVWNLLKPALTNQPVEKQTNKQKNGINTGQKKSKCTLKHYYQNVMPFRISIPTSNHQIPFLEVIPFIWPVCSRPSPKKNRKGASVIYR